MTLNHYLSRFQNLSMNQTNGSKSPHKVCLLLAVMDLIQDKVICSPEIKLNDALKARFTHHFNQRAQGRDRDTPENPFFHLRSEGFWHLDYREGYDKDTTKRYSAKAIERAHLDSALFEHMQSKLVVDELKEALEGNFAECIDNQVAMTKLDYQKPGGVAHDVIFNDIQAVMDDPSLTSTEKSILVKSRLGQDQFRSKLIKLWQGCSVTGYPAHSMLIASHIKPWRASNNQERLDKFNGLLLLPSLDKAFDQGFISFNTSGQVLISSSLEHPNVLGIEESMKIRLAQSHHNYLAYHRSEVFKG